MQKTKIAAEELAEMIRDGLAEEGHEVQVHPNPETGWHVAIISSNNAEDAGIRAEAIASGLRQSYRLAYGRSPLMPSQTITNLGALGSSKNRMAASPYR